uniref:Eppin n=1 Tax=Prolemur simus TaxID=1328070 RepID=A0A8C9AUT3_PROSS
MKSSGLLSLMVLCILFMNVLGPGLSEQFFSKRCPRVKEQCEFKERDLCTSDRQCPDRKKCCLSSCGRKCLDVEHDICTMPKKSGPCMALFLRWWYAKENNTCSLFVYGGCLGNDNNFQTKATCLNFCQKRHFS